MKKFFTILIASVMFVFASVTTVSVCAAESPSAPVIDPTEPCTKPDKDKDKDKDKDREPNHRPQRPAQNNPNNGWYNGMGYNPNYFYPNGMGGYYPIIGVGGTDAGVGTSTGTVTKPAGTSTGTVGGTTSVGSTDTVVYLTADESFSSPKTGAVDFMPCLMATFTFVAVFAGIKVAKTTKISF